MALTLPCSANLCCSLNRCTNPQSAVLAKAGMDIVKLKKTMLKIDNTDLNRDTNNKLFIINLFLLPMF